MLYVKEQLGLSSIKVTLDLYGHFLPSENRGVIDILDDVSGNATIRNLSATEKEMHTKNNTLHVR